MIVVKRKPKASVITMCAWKRPAYTWESIAAIASAAGFGDHYRVLVHIDGGGHPELESMVLHMGVKNITVVQEKQHIGCAQNTRNAIDHGFENSDYVIHIEDDVVVAFDALRYFQWAKDLRSDNEITTVNAWRHCHGYYPGRSPRSMAAGEAGDCGKMRFFQPWGWATWKDRWKELRSMWPKSESEVEWDHKLNQAGIIGLYPMVSRSINIGWRDGMHGDGGGCYLPLWAGSDGFIPDKFHISNPRISDYVHVDPD